MRSDLFVMVASGKYKITGYLFLFGLVAFVAGLHLLARALERKAERKTAAAAESIRAFLGIRTQADKELWAEVWRVLQTPEESNRIVQVFAKHLLGRSEPWVPLSDSALPHPKIRIMAALIIAFLFGESDEYMKACAAMMCKLGEYQHNCPQTNEQLLLELYQAACSRDRMRVISLSHELKQKCNEPIAIAQTAYAEVAQAMCAEVDRVHDLIERLTKLRAMGGETAIRFCRFVGT